MKNVSLTFDTVTEMINDKSLTSGMSVECLGYNTLNDKNGGTYRIFSIYETETEKTPKDITLVSDESLFARKIDTIGVTGDVSTIIESITVISGEINDLTSDVNEISSTVNAINEIATSANDVAERAYGIAELAKDEVDGMSEEIDTKIDNIDPFEVLSTLDFSSKAGIKLYAHRNGVKCLLVDKFGPVDDVVRDEIPIDGATDDLTKVIIDGEEMTPWSNTRFVDPDGVTYVYVNNVLSPTYASIAIDSITEDSSKVIIDGEEKYPSRFIFYSTALDDTYLYDGVLLYKVIAINSISSDKTKIIIEYDDIDPERDTIYVTQTGKAYVFNGYQLYDVTVIYSVLPNLSMYVLYNKNNVPEEKVVYKKGSDHKEYIYNGRVLVEHTPDYCVKVDSVSPSETKVIINGEEVTPEENVIYIDMSRDMKFVYNGEYLYILYDYMDIIGVSEDYTKVIIDGIEIPAKEGIIYTDLVTGIKYTYDGNRLQEYTVSFPNKLQ